MNIDDDTNTITVSLNNSTISLNTERYTTPEHSIFVNATSLLFETIEPSDYTFDITNNITVTDGTSTENVSFDSAWLNGEVITMPINSECITIILPNDQYTITSQTLSITCANVETGVELHKTYNLVITNE